MSSRRYAGAASAALFLAWIACGRNLSLPSGGPTVSAVYGLGREDGGTPDGGLPALAGELVAVHGSGFGSNPRLVEVSVGTSPATVVDAQETRLVISVPALPGSGQADVAVTTSGGIGALSGGLRYDGPGAPPPAVANSVPTTVSMRQVAPVEIPTAFAAQFRQDAVLGSLAVAVGDGDSALIVMPFEGVALAAVPLGIVPVSVTARFFPLAGFGTPTAGEGPLQLEILAVDRQGNVAVSGVNFALTTAWSGTGATASLPAGYPVVAPGLVPTASCEAQQVLFTRNGNYAAVTWKDTGKVHRIAALTGLDPTLTVAPALKGSPVDAKGQVISWSPTGTFAAPGNTVAYAVDATTSPTAYPSALYSFDPSPPAPVAPAPLLSTVDQTGIQNACGTSATATISYTAVTVSQTQNRTAVAFAPAGDVPRVAEVDASLTINTTSTIYSCGFSGPAASTIAYCSDPAAPLGAPWVLAATLANVQRFTRPPLPTPVTGTVNVLVADAAVQLGDNPLLSVPSFGGFAPVASRVPTTLPPSNVWRLPVVTPTGDLQTLMPVTMTNLGPVYRLAPYGGVSVMMAEVDTSTAAPVAVADHTLLVTGNGGLLDTAGAAFLLPLQGGSPISLGGGSYGRSAAWLARSGVGALAYTADLTGAGIAGGLGVFTRDVCESGYRLTVSQRVTGTGAAFPDLLVEGPARAQLFGPGSVERFGPSPPPIYIVSSTKVDSVPINATTFPCLLAGDWTGCGRVNVADLGLSPLEVILSVGDATLAARHLDLASCTASCGTSSFCLRASCPVAKDLVLAKPGSAASTVALPAAPLSVAADRAGGFVVSLACNGVASAAGPAACFASGTLCSGPSFQLSSLVGAGALVLVPEDGTAPQCLAVRYGLGGSLALSPNGAEAWVAYSAAGGSLSVTRLSIPRKTADGTIDLTAPLPFLTREILGSAGVVPPGFAATGVAFSPDGSIGVSTIPAEFRIAIFE